MKLNDIETKLVAEAVKKVTAKKETEVLGKGDKDFIDLHSIDKKKRRGSEPLTEKDVEEANEFTKAAAKAAVAGDSEFEFEGETYPVEMDKEVAKKIVGEQKKSKQESVELEEANTDKYMWKDINKALMSAGVNPRTIMKVTAGLKGKAIKEFVEADELDKIYFEESTAEYAKSLEKIANDRKMKNLSKKDKETLVKIANLLKRANEATGKETVDEAIDPRKFALGGNTKATKRDVDAILSKIFMSDKLAKQVEGSEAYKAGFKSKGKGKNPYKKDTADFHLYILGQQSAQAS